MGNPNPVRRHWTKAEKDRLRQTMQAKWAARKMGTPALIKVPKARSSRSWWLDLDRSTLNARARQEQTRMSSSREGRMVQPFTLWSGL